MAAGTNAAPLTALHAEPPGVEDARRRTRERSALCVAVLIAALACVFLGRIVHQTEWTMDADEAVHATEALRLHDDLARGRLGAFFRDTYFPERWQPPVNPHVRWYPFVHAWSVLPSFAVLGPSDFSARLPSIVFLFGTCLVFFELGRRLSPRHGGMSGLLAVALLLASPNVLTFCAQSLIEPASLFFSFLALLAYVWSLERDHPRGRAALAGAALGLAMWTKYDHGGLLALCLGVSELMRNRLNVALMLRTGSGQLFLIALAMIALWFAHPDKIDALKDSVSHPFYGSSRLIFLDFVLTWFTEYGSSLAMGAVAIAAFLVAWRSREPGMRALWIWILVTTFFLAVRARFHFRYNFVEAPGFLLLAAVLLPGWVERWSLKLGGHAVRGRLGWGLALGVAGAAGVMIGGALALGPDGVFERLRGSFAWFHGLREDAWGMSLGPDHYVDHFAALYRDVVHYLGASLAVLGLGVLIVGVAAIVLERNAGERAHARAALWCALAVAAVPGAARLYANLPGMVEWELESHPALNEVYAFVREHAPAPTTILLGGGWDQLTNNGVAWYHLTGADGERPNYGEVRVVGDMIGSVVFPPEPRIEHWARVLGEGSPEELPDRLVLVDHGDDFLYEARMGPEASVYRAVVAARGGYRPLASRDFEALGCRVEILGRSGEPGAAVDGVTGILAAHGIGPDTPGNASRTLVGEGGWVMKDEALRHFVRR